jgi:inner membrane protein
MSQANFQTSAPDNKNFRRLLPLVGTLAHVLASLLPLAWISTNDETTPSIGVVFLVMLEGLLPDIDTGSSLIGRVFPFVSQPLERQFGHRTITHSLLALFIVGALNYLLFADAWFVITMAYASHLILDMIVGKTGIPLLYPVRISFDILQITPESTGEIIVLIVLALALIMPAMAPGTAQAVANFAPTPEPTETFVPLPWRITPTRDRTITSKRVVIFGNTSTPKPKPTPKN